MILICAILIAAMLWAIACASDEAAPNATATTAPPTTVPAGDRPAEPPTTAPTDVPPTNTPASASGPVTIDIDVNGDALQFSLASMSASAGPDVVVNFNNSPSVNSHNWAVVEAGTKDAVAADGTAAGPDNNWLPVNDSRIFASTILIGPGASAQATFTAPPAGTYQFVCTFPGHSFTMFGDSIVN